MRVGVDVVGLVEARGRAGGGAVGMATKNGEEGARSWGTAPALRFATAKTVEGGVRTVVSW